jgi:hypothetical protein
MFSSHALRDFAEQRFHLEALPPIDETDILTGVQALLSERGMSRSELCRWTFTDRRLQILAQLPQETIARFLGVSAALVARCRSAAEADLRAHASHDPGRPILLSAAAEEAIVRWAQTRCKTRDWPTVREFREQVVAHLEEAGSDAAPSQSSYMRILERLLSDDFQVRRAQALEESRFDLAPETTELRFRN